MLQEVKMFSSQRHDC